MKKPTKEEIILERDLKEASYIGEEGGMAVDGRLTQLGAYRKMVARIREDCGDEEVETFKENCSADDLGIAYFHLVTPANKHEFDYETEWYISVEKESPYKVWVFWG